MKLKVLHLTLKSLWNSEYTMYINLVVAKLLAVDTDALRLKKVALDLQGVLPYLAKIAAQELGNLKTLTLTTLDTTRDLLFDGLVDLAYAYEKMHVPAELDAVAQIQHFFTTHGRDISSANYLSESQRLNDMFTAYDNNSLVKAAAQTLHMVPYFELLRTANTQFVTEFNLRSDEEATAEKVDSKAIRAECDDKLNALFTAIDYCIREYDGIDYTELVNKINEITAYYKAQLKARATRHHNGADVTKEAPIEDFPVSDI